MYINVVAYSSVWYKNENKKKPGKAAVILNR